MPKIIVLTGLPGSGKSTYLKQRGIASVSSDQLRELLSGDATDQGIHKGVFAAVRYLVRQRLRLGQAVTYVDATHLTPWERKPYIEIAGKYGCAVESLYFDVPLEECKRRNQGRDRVVPDDVLDRMAKKLVKPSKSEGFSSVRIAPKGHGDEGPRGGGNKRK